MGLLIWRTSTPKAECRSARKTIKYNILRGEGWGTSSFFGDLFMANVPKAISLMTFTFHCIALKDYIRSWITCK